MARAGRPSIYTPELAQEICRRIALGRTVSDVCSDEDMPTSSCVREWAADNREGFAAMYARARMLLTESLVDEIIEISDDKSRDFVQTDDGLKVDHDHINRSKLRVDSRKWLASKIAPKLYGDRVALTGADGGPLVVSVMRLSDDPEGAD